jgi:hypothetical protein
MKKYTITTIDGDTYSIIKQNVTLNDIGVDFITEDGKRYIIPWHQIKIVVLYGN